VTGQTVLPYDKKYRAKAVLPLAGQILQWDGNRPCPELGKLSCRVSCLQSLRPSGPIGVVRDAVLQQASAVEGKPGDSRFTLYRQSANGGEYGQGRFL
jgi:hypothetical protein